MLKDPKEAATTQRFHGLYLGKIPTGTSLTYVLYDWQYEKSKEFHLIGVDGKNFECADQSFHIGHKNVDNLF